MVLGLIFYPIFNQMILVDLKIKLLSEQALLLLTLAIPSRLSQFVLTMIMHSIGEGKNCINQYHYTTFKF